MVITPNFHFHGDCEDAMKLYQKAFSATRMPIHRIMSLTADGAAVFIMAKCFFMAYG